jgi:RimJ/RimL family protein N-acetyltransferase
MTVLAGELIMQPEPLGAAGGLWARACAGLDPVEACFGPEGLASRPRPGETYWTAWLDPMAPGPVGLVWLTRPAPTTATFGLGLFEAWRGRGLGAALRDAALVVAFDQFEVWKVETSIYLSNARSLTVLHQHHGRMREEGVQRDTITVHATFCDRLLVGLTRAEWEAQEAAR